MPPALGVRLAVVLVIAKSAAGFTTSVAVTKLGLAPTEVVKEPAGMVLATCGVEVEVTTADTEQLALGAISVPVASDNCVPPGAATGAGPLQVLATSGVAALNKPVGYSSTKAALKVAVVNLCVFVKVMTSSEVPPALIVLGLNVLDTVGKLAVTVSISAAVQVPAAQPAAELVLVTPSGGDIEAVLVTWVCANAACGMPNAANKPIANTSALSAWVIENRENLQRLKNLAIANMKTPKYYFFSGRKT